MIRYEVSVHIKSPVERVFAFLIDATHLRDWQADLVETEQLTEGSIRLGSRFREVRRMGPRQSEIQAEITSFVPSQHFSTATMVGPEATVRYAFDEEQGGTRVTCQFALKTSGFTRLMEPLISSSMKKQAQADFRTLKQILEND